MLLIPRPLFRIPLLIFSIFLFFKFCYGIENTNKIESILLRSYKRGFELFLKTSRPVQIFSYSTSDPPTIKIEFKDSLAYQQKEQIVLEKNSSIDKIKLLKKPQEKAEEGVLVTHLVLELKRPLEYEIFKRDNTIALRLNEKSPPHKKKREIEPKKLKYKDSPERIIERDFIEFIKKARIRWQKEEETIKRLMAQIEREKYLEEKRLRKQERFR
ncbi:MAG: hypothetical protein FJZ16_04400, partial [Candidatus Omnitrophica bacterium]|nr:hypothetical protein [Candidatus Omnitrophota bacterium]